MDPHGKRKNDTDPYGSYRILIIRNLTVRVRDFLRSAQMCTVLGGPEVLISLGSARIRGSPQVPSALQRNPKLATGPCRFPSGLYQTGTFCGRKFRFLNAEFIMVSLRDLADAGNPTEGGFAAVAEVSGGLT